MTADFVTVPSKPEGRHRVDFAADVEGAMQTRKLLGVAAIVCGLAVLPAPSSAHHSFAAEWDSTKCRDFTGTLRKLDWQNPHPYFFVDVKESNGKVEQWSFQAYSPVTLRRNGTDRQVFLDNIDKDVWIRGCLSKTGKPNAAAAGTLKFSDGVLRQVGQLQD
jgi:hypothetical protein